MSQSLALFLFEQPFVEQNRPAIEGIFAQLATDFPDRIVKVEGEEIATREALTISDTHELTPTAHEWLGAHAIGTQHGYDRMGDRLQKVFIEPGDPAYMGKLALIDVGWHNLVDGGRAAVSVAGRNILVGGGFPHLAPGRLRHALDGEHALLWDAHTTTILTGQRRRWNDNPNEDTMDKVVGRTAEFTGFDLSDDQDRIRVEHWQRTSPFARGQEASRSLEGQAWQQAYATESEMGRAAAELALLRSEGLFDWDAYPVKEHWDENAEPIDFDGYHVPARDIQAWEYKLENGKSLYVVNGKAVVRDRGGEPRPTSASVMEEATTLLAHDLRAHENIIAFGAPHIRAGIHTAIQLITATKGETMPVHLTNDRWEFHEPPITGIASIPGTEIVDRQLRQVVATLQ